MIKKIVLGMSILFLSTCIIKGAELPAELPKAMGMQFGMSMNEVSPQLILKNLKVIDKKENMLAFRGSLVSVDRPIATYTYYEIIKFEDPTKSPEKKLCRIITFFDITALDNTATDLISRYMIIKDALIQKYGQVSYEREFSDPIFDDPDIRLQGIQSGNSEYFSAWEKKGLYI